MAEIKEKKNNVVNPDLLKGNWKLTYKLVNDKGIGGFSGRQITSYHDPITGRMRHLTNTDGDELPGYFIETTVVFFNPTQNTQDRLTLDWLIGHPMVGVENSQTKIDGQYMSRKESNPRIKLVNLDHEDIRELRRDDYIDKLVGTLSLDSGVNAVSLDKLRFVLSKLGLSYRDEKYINDRAIEKQKLRDNLKKYVRSSYENAQSVNAILEDLEDAKLEYEIKEMVRVDILNVSNGMFKYINNPIGVSVESVKKYFSNNPDFYSELTEKLYNEIK